MININMRLFELISTTQSIKKSSKNYDPAKAKEFFDKNFEAPTAGAYALGSDDKKDPHMFNKKNFFPADLKEDPYYQYINAIKNSAGENPCFPRVYNISINQSADGHVTPSYKIEKLQRPDDFSSEAMMALGERTIKDFNTMYYGHYAAAYPNSIFKVMIGELRHMLSTGYSYSIKDKNLQAAVEVIRKIKSTNKNFQFDMHAGNAMLRGTPKGPQLVITDPLATTTLTRD